LASLRFRLAFVGVSLVVFPDACPGRIGVPRPIADDPDWLPRIQ
jgi:hypothetical protein